MLDVLSKGTILRLKCIDAMAETSYAISFLPLLLHLLTNFLDYTGIIASDRVSWRG